MTSPSIMPAFTAMAPSLLFANSVESTLPCVQAQKSYGKPISADAKANIKRILVCQLRQIGDVLLSTPSVAMLAKEFPQAEIHFFTEKKCAPMLQHNPHIHTVWGVDKKELPTLLHELRFYRQIASVGFDLVVCFQSLPRIRWVVAMSGASLRLGFPPAWYLRPLYTHWAQPNPCYAGIFKSGILAPLGITWQGETPELYLTQEETAEAAAFLLQWGIQPATTPFITLDVTHRRKTRRWPNEKYAEVIDSLAAKYPALHFVVPYGPGEQEEVEALRALCAYKDRVIVPHTMISLRQLAACMTFAEMHLGNCSAPRHIAVAVGVPTVTILGATSTGWTFPSEKHNHVLMGLDCQPCNKNTCPIHYKCLAELPAQQVTEAASACLEKFGTKLRLQG